MFEKKDANKAPTTGASSSLTPRGARRRIELIEAALKIIVREGPGAVTLRSVVAEANASHGSISYYFGSREELIQESLIYVATKNTEAFSRAWEEIEQQPAEPALIAKLLARYIVKQMTADRAMSFVIMELHLASARDENLRLPLRQWGRAYANTAKKTFVALGSKTPEVDIGIFVNIINGLILRQLALPRSDFEDNVLRPLLERLFRSLRE